MGHFEETVDFDPGSNVQNLTSIGSIDTFIQKLDSNGDLLWVKQVGGILQDIGLSMTIDATGNLYITGFFAGTIDLDPGLGVQILASTGDEDTFIQKLDTNGDLIWAERGIADSRGYAITVDINGNIYVTGYLVVSYYGNSDIYIQKLNSTGDFLWTKQMGGYAFDAGNSISTDPDGNVYTVGRFYGVVDFNPGSGVEYMGFQGNKNIFIQKLDTNGNFLWAKRISGGFGSLDNKGRYITNDADGNVYTTGSFYTPANSPTVDFDPGPGEYNLTSLGYRDIFIQKLDTNGDFLWVEQIGGIGLWDEGSAMTIDADENLYLTGWFSETVDFAPGSGVQNLTSNGISDAFTQKFSQCPAGISTDTHTTCNAYTWIDGITYTENNNTATFNIPGGAANGCDSLVTLNLTINNVSDITTTVNNAIITSNNSNATYQWLDCNNSYAPLVGEISQSFTATMNGNYAVELTENGCTEISDCVLITTVALYENSLADEFVLYPNPTTGNFAIKFDNIQKALTVRLFAVSGQVILDKKFQNTHLIQLDINQPDGVYLLEMVDADGNKAVVKLLKE